MKASVRTAVLSVSLLGLAACATTGEESAYNASAVEAPQTRFDNDEAYMARVEAYARRRGIDLTWVNPPRRIAAKDD